VDDAKASKPLLLQSGAELMDSAVGERTTHALMASGGDWVKANSERRLPSRHNKSNGR
jgi:hypothetical protein